jgi:hypothetical protein
VCVIYSNCPRGLNLTEQRVLLLPHKYIQSIDTTYIVCVSERVLSLQNNLSMLWVHHGSQKIEAMWDKAIKILVHFTFILIRESYGDQGLFYK